jgi:flagellar P-ring protein precursor FlgI
MDSTMNRCRLIIILWLIVASVGTGEPCAARTVLRNICRVKGQEENVLRGLGLVVGLAGTGEAADAQTMRALAQAMDIMGSPVPELPLAPGGGLKDLEKIKNVAMVWVTAHVPATGARRGDKLNCHVSAINGKSLAGGRLAFAALKGPNVLDKTIYALCEGPVHLDDPTQPLVGVVSAGCQMEADVFTPFVQDGRITLILDENHASFLTATEVAESIYSVYSGEADGFVRAINASNIVVQIPAEYKNDPVAFAAEVLDQTVYTPEPEARVTINQKAGTVVISGDVTIGDVIVTNKNVVIEAGLAAEFTALDPDQTDDAKLEALVAALNSLKVPHEDVVDIIKGIAQAGKLHGRLIIE